MRRSAFTIIELIAAVSILAVLGIVGAGAAREAYKASSLAVSASNIRQLAAGGVSYLAENNYTYWPYRQNNPANGVGVTWWFGFEPGASVTRPEGERSFDATRGPLGEYVPKSMRPDPSFAIGARAFKPKYRNGYIGVGYNVLLGGGWGGARSLLQNHWQLNSAKDTVVFFSSAQVNTFQSPASSSRPMLEEFYGIDERERTVHFRHRGSAMVSFADGNVGFLKLDPTLRDNRMPSANVGRFAPVGDTTHLR